MPAAAAPDRRPSRAGVRGPRTAPARASPEAGARRGRGSAGGPRGTREILWPRAPRLPPGERLVPQQALRERLKERLLLGQDGGSLIEGLLDQAPHLGVDRLRRRL